MTDSDLIRETCKLICEEAKDDYVGLWSIGWILRENFCEKDLFIIRKLTLEVVKEVMQKHLLVAGSIEENDFRRWTINTEQILHQIEKYWLDGGDIPGMGEIVWFESIEK